MPRKQGRTTVSHNIVLEWSSAKREARISDISLGGCFVDCLTPINEGEPVTFKIDLGENESLSLSGRVVYVFPGVGFGLQFDPLSASECAALEHFIVKNNGDPWNKDEPENFR